MDGIEKAKGYAQISQVVQLANEYADDMIQHKFSENYVLLVKKMITT